VEKNIKEHLDRLQQKLQQVIKKFQSVSRENEVQKKQLEALKLENSELRDRVRLLEEQSYILKASTGSMGDQDKKEFEQTINKYIREIDKCIGLLNE
jgi:predicted transcriptional regulator